MSSDEEDYLSDKFLYGEQQKDVRPGLIRNRALQREVEVKAKKQKIDEENRRKITFKTRLEEGLDQALTSDNKGFALLSKMGYKPGTSLGKSSGGIVEPIGITLKTGRGGLGREAALQQLQQKRQAIRAKRLMGKTEEVSTEEFRRRMIEKSQGKRIEADLRQSQKACERLDGDSGIEEPAMAWFWPERKQAKTEEEEQLEETENVEDEEEIEEYLPSEKLEMLTNYLRTSYCYCLWCGIQFKDEEDMKNCPGETYDDH